MAAAPTASVQVIVAGLAWPIGDEQFAPLFPTRGQPAVAPWRLKLVTLPQFTEDLTDRQPAEAVQRRIDWNYALPAGRYRGFPKTRLQHALIAISMQLVRLVAWFADPTHSQTQTSHFVVLAPPPEHSPTTS